MPSNIMTNIKDLTIEKIKNLGVRKSDENMELLLNIYNKLGTDIDLKREVVSSIGRQKNNEKILHFIEDNVYKCGYMDLVYQMYRTCLYKQKNNPEFFKLANEIYDYFDNEVLYKMKYFYDYRQKRKTGIITGNKQIKSPTILPGDNVKTLKKIKDGEVQLIFTSPPYYNARVYSDYKSYKDYLYSMKQTLQECFRVLEDGRFIIINISPVITKRPGREFESIRYPIHFDFHRILTESGFYFIDEILWIKPESSVKNRNGGYQQTRMPLSYKPNCISESLLVYRKKAPFLLDKNIHKYNKNFANDNSNFDTTNCWFIPPKANKEHPAVFPEELCQKILTYYSFKTDVVLDPFAGSGTFGKVAKKMGRIPVLCEINDKYCGLIRRDHYDEL